MSLMKRARAERVRQGISQTDLAERLGRSQVTLSNWEQGKNDPPLGGFERLLAELRGRLFIRWETDKASLGDFADCSEIVLHATAGMKDPKLRPAMRRVLLELAKQIDDLGGRA